MPHGLAWIRRAAGFRSLHSCGSKVPRPDSTSRKGLWASRDCRELSFWSTEPSSTFIAILPCLPAGGHKRSAHWRGRLSSFPPCQDSLQPWSGASPLTGLAAPLSQPALESFLLSMDSQHTAGLSWQALEKLWPNSAWLSLHPHHEACVPDLTRAAAGLMGFPFFPFLIFFIIGLCANKASGRCPQNIHGTFNCQCVINKTKQNWVSW